MIVVVCAVTCAVLAPAALARTVEDILAGRPFAPTDPALMSSTIYPATPPMVPASGPALTEAQAAAMLDAYLAAEFPGDAAAQAAGKAIFNDATAKSKIATPSLRAALAALSGTFAEPAIAFVLHAEVSPDVPKVEEVRLSAPEELPGSVVAAVHVDAMDQMTIVFNERFQAENPFLLSGSWAHEALHQDQPNSNYEEGVSNSLDDLFYIRQLVRHPGLARAGTQLARLLNTTAMARLNTGLTATLGLYESNGQRPVRPGSTSLKTSWWQVFDNGNTSPSPGNVLLDSYLANIGATCQGQSFSKSVLDCIDAAGNGGLTSAELLAAARALELDFDTDGDGKLDSKDNCVFVVNAGQADADLDRKGDPCDPDDDNDGLLDTAKSEAGPARVDRDSDDDGLGDAREITKTKTKPRKFDTDGDGISDGVERGVTKPVADPPGAVLGTNLTKFRKDRDPTTKTNAKKKDTDGDGRSDGAEDKNKNGRRDKGETNPLREDSTFVSASLEDAWLRDLRFSNYEVENTEVASFRDLIKHLPGMPDGGDLLQTEGDRVRDPSSASRQRGSAPL